MNFSVMDELQAYLETERSEHRLHYNELQLLKRGENLACGDLVVKRLRRSLRWQTIGSEVWMGFLFLMLAFGTVPDTSHVRPWESPQLVFLLNMGLVAYRWLQWTMRQIVTVARLETIVSLAKREAGLSGQANLGDAA